MPYSLGSGARLPVLFHNNLLGGAVRIDTEHSKLDRTLPVDKEDLGELFLLPDVAQRRRRRLFERGGGYQSLKIPGNV